MDKNTLKFPSSKQDRDRRRRYDPAWKQRLVEACLEPGVRSHPLINGDETTVQVLKEKNKEATSTSYMWAYRSGEDSDEPIVLLDDQPGRGQIYPQTFLGDYCGILVSDGYTSWRTINGLVCDKATPPLLTLDSYAPSLVISLPGATRLQGLRRESRLPIRYYLLRVLRRPHPPGSLCALVTTSAVLPQDKL